jgi:uncharacterized protein (DUF362 family)
MMTKQTYDYRVRATHCDHRADEETVYRALRRATDPLDRAWAKLRAADTIAIKFNQDFDTEQMVMFKGQRQQLVSHKVARAVLRILREETDAELFCVDTTHFANDAQPGPRETTQLLPVLQAFDVAYVNADAPPHTIYQVPNGGQMFKQYLLPAPAMEADARVDVQKMKNHAFMGVTLTLKNLFGLMPKYPHGRSRQYYHHLVRMPYMLADLGQLFRPSLTIVDALVAQAGMEWGDGEGLGRVCDTLMAGDHPVATDACGMTLMGFDPQGDWLSDPFHRDRNALLVAAEGGYGTVDLDAIDFESEVDPQPEGTFFATTRGDSLERIVSWRRTMCEQALYYRDHRDAFVDAYGGQFILLQMGKVRWHSPEGHITVSRRKLAGEHPNQAMFFKYVDPDEAEGERFEVYEQALAHLEALDLRV